MDGRMLRRSSGSVDVSGMRRVRGREEEDECEGAGEGIRETRKVREGR